MSIHFFDSEELRWLKRDEYVALRDKRIKDAQLIAEKEAELKAETIKLREVLRNEAVNTKFHI
jgi:hypothetical protein